MNRTPSRNAADGTASIQNIQRQAGAPSQKVAPAPPATLGENVIAQEGAEQSQHNSHLLQRGEPAAHVWRGDLRDVHRGQHAGGADGQTAHDARGDEEAGRAGQRRRRRRSPRKKTAFSSMVGRRP